MVTSAQLLYQQVTPTCVESGKWRVESGEWRVESVKAKEEEDC